ncbi:MAG: hypothetical protein R6V44_01890 [Paracoccaceae bacterium]
MFVHGARSFRLNGDRPAHRIGAWLDDLDGRAHQNVATVAFANGIARSPGRSRPAAGAATEPSKPRDLSRDPGTRRHAGPKKG